MPVDRQARAAYARGLEGANDAPLSNPGDGEQRRRGMGMTPQAATWVEAVPRAFPEPRPRCRGTRAAKWIGTEQLVHIM